MSLLLSAGCGSDPQQAAGQPGPASTPGQNSLLNVFSGRVLLRIPAANAQVSAYSLRGDLLATTSAGPLGCFVLPTGLPSDFRVIARLGGETLATEVRNYDGTRRHVVINVPTSLVSLAAAGSTDLGAAEARVRRILHISPGTSLETGIEESGRADFSHLKFFLEVGSAGGTTALAQQLLVSTINATYIGGYSPSQNRYPVTLTTSNVSLTATAANHTLLGIQILPRNRLYSFPVTMETQTDKYTVLAFYNDQAIVEITQDSALQLTVVDALTNLSTAGATFIDDNPYEQLNLVKSKLQTTSTKKLTIRVSFGTATDSAAGLASY